VAGGLGPHLIDADLEAAQRCGKFRAQAILVRLDRIDRERQRVVELPCREPRSASVYERYESQYEQAPGAEPDAEQHE
jgi:hypothetical protein